MLDDVWNEDYNEWDNLKSLLIGDVKGNKILMTCMPKQLQKLHVLFKHTQLKVT